MWASGSSLDNKTVNIVLPSASTLSTPFNVERSRAVKATREASHNLRRTGLIFPYLRIKGDTYILLNKTGEQAQALASFDVFSSGSGALTLGEPLITATLAAAQAAWSSSCCHGFFHNSNAIVKWQLVPCVSSISDECVVHSVLCEYDQLEGVASPLCVSDEYQKFLSLHSPAGETNESLHWVALSRIVEGSSTIPVRNFLRSLLTSLPLSNLEERIIRPLDESELIIYGALEPAYLRKHKHIRKLPQCGTSLANGFWERMSKSSL